MPAIVEIARNVRISELQASGKYDDESDIIRTGINNWFENTVPSRLDNPNKGCIIIIMQRTHEDDLCGHLIERMKNKT